MQQQKTYLERLHEAANSARRWRWYGIAATIAAIIGWLV